MSEEEDVTANVGFAFHCRDAFRMSSCYCGFSVQGFGAGIARSEHRMKSHLLRCPVARGLTDEEYHAERERKALSEGTP